MESPKGRIKIPHFRRREIGSRFVRFEQARTGVRMHFALYRARRAERAAHRRELETQRHLSGCPRIRIEAFRSWVAAMRS